MPVLRDAVLRDVQIGHDFDAGDEGLVGGALQIGAFHHHAVHPHAHHGALLERLDVDVRRAGGGGPLHQRVEQPDDGGVIVPGHRHVDGKFVPGGGAGKGVVGGAGGSAGGNFRVVVADGPFQRLLLRQNDLQIPPGELADVLDAVVVQRVVHRQRQQRAVLPDDQHGVFHGQLPGQLFHRPVVHRQRGKIHHPQAQTLGQRLQHLLFRHKAQRLQGLPDAQLPVLLLVGQRLVQLVGGDVAVLDQNVTDADVFQFSSRSLSHRYTLTTQSKVEVAAVSPSWFMVVESEMANRRSSMAG